MDSSITKNMFFSRKKTMIGVLSPLPKELTYQTRYLDLRTFTTSKLTVPSLKIDLVIAKNMLLLQAAGFRFRPNQTVLTDT